MKTPEIVAAFVAAVVIVAVFRWVRSDDEGAADAARAKRLRGDADQAQRQRELDEQRVIKRPSVIDGPTSSTAYSRVVGERRGPVA